MKCAQTAAGTFSPQAGSRAPGASNPGGIGNVWGRHPIAASPKRNFAGRATSIVPARPARPTVRGRTLQGRARGSLGLRREERSGAMVPHRDRRTTKSVIRTPCAPAVRGRTLQGRARGSSGLRREERSGAMVPHRDRRTTKSVSRTPLRPAGYGGIGPSATLLLLDRWGTSTSSWRLAYGPMALVTRSLKGPATSC